MKKIIFQILSLLVVIMVSCTDKKPEPIIVEELVKINNDSIFKDLDQVIIKKRSDEVDAVFKMLRKKIGFNGTVLYAEQGRVVYENAFGWQDLRRHKVEMNEDCQFQLASVSKMFTAEAIMILQHQGLIDYDAKVCNYIQGFPYPDVSVRNLLNHRSGLSRYETLAHEQWKDKRVPITNNDMLQLFATYKPEPYFSANNGFHYCNTNYALLASVVEKTANMHFDEFVQRYIFDAVGMNKSFIYSMRDDSIVSTYIDKGVSGYDMRRRGARKSQNDYLNGVMGDKIMFSTVEDLYRFSNALDYSLLLPDSLQKESYKPGSPRKRNRTENYGFGWRLSSKHKNAVYHFGWWKGFRTFFIKDIEKNRVIIVLTNTDKGPNGDYFWNIINSTQTHLAPADVNISYIETIEGITFPHHPYNS